VYKLTYEALMKIVFLLTLSVLFSKNILADQLDTYLNQIDAKKIYGSLSESVYVSMMQQEDFLKPGLAKKIALSLKESYKTVDFYEGIKSELKSKIKDSDFKTLVEFRKSDFGKKITKMEVHCSTPKGMSEIPEFAKKLYKSKPDNLRIKLLYKVIKDTGTIDLSVDSAERTSFQIALGINASRSKKDKMTVLEMLNKIEMAKHTITKNVTEQLLMHSLFCYKDLSIKELVSYEGHVSNKVSLSVARTSNSAMKELHKKAMIGFEDNLEKRFKSKK